MTITLAQAQTFVSKVAGGSPELATATEYVNMAGEHLVSMCPWSWLNRPEAGIDFVADQSWAALPSDFGESISVDSSDLQGWAWVGFDEILEMRGGSISIAAGYVGAVVYAVPTDGTAAPDQPRLELYPTPSANATAALKVFYRARWTAVTTTTHALKIPSWMDLLFYEVLRATVLGLEEGDVASVSQRLTQVQQGSVYMQAKRKDTDVNNEAGALRNGVGQTPRGRADPGQIAFPDA